MKSFILSISVSVIMAFCAITYVNGSTFSSNNFRDTSVKNWACTVEINSDSAIEMSDYYLDSIDIFKDSWINDELFVYEKLEYKNLPDTIKILLVDSTEKFQLTWYGGLNSPYGPRWGRMHQGVDLFLRTGDSVVAAFDGVVRFAEFNSGGYGNCVIIRHLNGLETLYGHLSKIKVSPNQFVKSGQLIGLGGTTGRSDGPHLHFETRYKDFSINPFLFIDPETQELKTDSLVILKTNLINHRYPSDNKNAMDADNYSNAKGKYNPKKSKSKSAYSKSKKKVAHTVKKGESLSTIAARYHVSVKKLQQQNKSLKSNKIKPGQKIIIK